MSDGIGLARVIQQVRSELADAIQEGEGKDLRFTLQELELELQVVVTQDTDAKFGVSLKVIELGIGAKEQESRAHKVTVKLKPHRRGGGLVDVADEHP